MFDVVGVDFDAELVADDAATFGGAGFVAAFGSVPKLTPALGGVTCCCCFFCTLLN